MSRKMEKIVPQKNRMKDEHKKRHHSETYRAKSKT